MGPTTILLGITALLLSCTPEDSHHPNPNNVAPSIAELLDKSHTAISVDASSMGHMSTTVTTKAGTYTFLVDTGASVSVLSDTLADEHGIDLSQTSLQDIGAVEIGGLAFSDLAVVTMDLAAVNASTSTPIHGILGAPFFAAHSAYVDVGNLVLWVAPHTYSPQSLAVDLSAAGMSSTALKRNPIGFMMLPVTANRTPGLNTLVDTGATATVVEILIATELGLELRNGGGQATTVHGIASVSLSTLETLAMESLSLSHVDVAVMDLSQFNRQLDAAGLKTLDVILGIDILTQYKAVIDYPGARLFFYSSDY